MKEWDKYLVEAIGTFSLVFVGAGAVMVNTITNGALGLVGVALAHGLTLLAMIYAVGHISGTHINPAVTVGLFIGKKINGKTAVFYIISQLIGASVAGFLLLALFPTAPQALHLGVTDLAQGVTTQQGILWEAILTFFLVFVVYGAAVHNKEASNFAGIPIGLTLAFSILIGGPFTGAALNPARAFGPALASGYWATQIVYWIGPLIGAIVAALVYEYVIRGDKE
ncbi:MAG: aquaporin [Planctomycetes bacterium]|nr:aquaporin [Planctomycetota bacterium]